MSCTSIIVRFKFEQLRGLIRLNSRSWESSQRIRFEFFEYYTELRLDLSEFIDLNQWIRLAFLIIWSTIEHLKSALDESVEKLVEFCFERFWACIFWVLSYNFPCFCLWTEFAVHNSLCEFVSATLWTDNRLLPINELVTSNWDSYWMWLSWNLS